MIRTVLGGPVASGYRPMIVDAEGYEAYAFGINVEDGAVSMAKETAN